MTVETEKLCKVRHQYSIPRTFADAFENYMEIHSFLLRMSEDEINFEDKFGYITCDRFGGWELWDGFGESISGEVYDTLGDALDWLEDE